MDGTDLMAGMDAPQEKPGTGGGKTAHNVISGKGHYPELFRLR